MLLSMGICLLLGLRAQSAIFVDTNGSDSNPGTAHKPLATLIAARDRARQLHVHRIVVGVGEFQLTDTLSLDAQDSGLSIQAASIGKASLTGALVIPPSSIHPCTDQAVVDRIIDVSARSHILEVDLQKLGILTLDPIQPRGFPHSVGQAPNELFQGTTPLTLARWPNTGFSKVGKVSEPGNGEHEHDKPIRLPVFSIGDRALKWSEAEDPWMYGYWKFDWADESIRVHKIDSATGQITLETPAVYGVDTGVPFFAENLLEELDAPGEYYISRASKKLYFIPLSDAGKGKDLRLSVLNKPLISINGASNVTIRGFGFEFSGGDGVAVHNGDHVRFEACRFADLGERAGEIDGGHDCGFLSCNIQDTGEGGVRLNGGDRKTLEASRHFVENCEIQNFERRSQTYRPAVWLDGVGNRVSHCYIHDAPHSAIIYGGNNHVIEYNRFSKTISLTGDGGVVYTGRDWTARGTKIQFNWFEDNVGQRKWEPAMYVDDLGSGISMIGNLVERSHWGFLIGGGRNNVLKDNVLVGCDLAFDCDARGLGWAANSRPTMMERLVAMPYQSAIWQSSYPELANILTENPMAPFGNILIDNLLIGSGTVTKQMESPFKTTATIQGNREEAQPTADDIRRIDRMRKAAGLVNDGLRRSLGK
jgi:hypothetical protein